MPKKEIYAEFENIEDPAKEFGKILGNLHYTHFFLMDRYKKILSSYGLTSPQSNVLTIIGHYYPRPMALEEIKNMVLEPNSDVSRIVTRLAEKGFVEKVKNSENRRKVAIMLTAKGLKVERKLLEDKNFQQFTSSLTRQEARNFAKVLAKFRETQD